ncbi:UDP-glycosyltransferase 73C4 [Vitis vinifera]|uniref:UDP-glycosyltransferase 73C4 n=1 Tax=Vitis vinifera TaxID=29760 RepID=A0A438JSW6_VITVI|nr:UDP-glycosyltransferase 73C4 [Vitis vinifera]
MASQSHQLHVVLIPFMTQGHLIPMIDMAILLAQRGLIVTIISTPLNASRFNTSISWAIESGLLIRVIQLRFPSHEAGLPEGCETMDNLPSRELLANFYVAIRMLQQPVEKLFEEMKPSPSCIISDANLAWPADTARKFQVSESEPFVVPGLPHRITLTRAQLPGAFSSNFSDLNDTRREIRAAELVADGVVVNSFEELEAEYVKEYRKVKGDKIWCIGPVSVCHKEDIDKAQRGNNTSTDQNQCLKWLDSWEPSSVVYACLGSLSNITPPTVNRAWVRLRSFKLPEEKFGVLVKWEEVQKAISKVMDKGPEGRKRRERVRKLGVMANKAMEQGGSSNHNIALLIENIKQHATVHSSKDTS